MAARTAGTPEILYDIKYDQSPIIQLACCKTLANDEKKLLLAIGAAHELGAAWGCRERCP